ncbi:MAG: HI0074 family nucleotidyltransferase substrate-binding subunit [Pseudomonadota bacterium]
MSLTFSKFIDAVTKLQNAVNMPKDEYMRDSVMQRFEFCIDLAWKVSKKSMGTSTTAPKGVVREMAQNGFINDVQKWLLSIDMRNLCSHTYNEELAERVYQFAVAFLPE